MPRSTFSQIRSALYKTQRAMGDIQAAERGPAPLAKRIVRRKVTRHVMRGWDKLWRGV